MLQAVKDFLAAIADNFTQPNIAIDRDEQGALMQTGWLGVGDNDWIEEVIPDLYDLSLGAAFVDAQLRKDARHDGARWLGAQGLRPLERRQIDASPLSEHTFARCGFARAARRDVAGGRGQHLVRES